MRSSKVPGAPKRAGKFTSALRRLCGRRGEHLGKAQKIRGSEGGNCAKSHSGRCPQHDVETFVGKMLYRLGFLLSGPHVQVDGVPSVLIDNSSNRVLVEVVETPA